MEQAVKAILDAAEKGRADELGRLLDERLDLIDASSSGDSWGRTALHMAACCNRAACVRLLLDQGADVRIRDSATMPMPCTLRLRLRIWTWSPSWSMPAPTSSAKATTTRSACSAGRLVSVVCANVAAYLLVHGAKLNLWSAIALDREDDVRGFIAHDPSLISARMSRNEQRRTPLHHAAANNRLRMVRLLLDLGADPNASDTADMTALTAASREHADPAIITMLLAAGAKLDFASALYLERYELAEAMLRDDPSRISPNGRDTIALHFSVRGKNAAGVRWLIAHGVDVNAKRSLWECNRTALHNGDRKRSS